MAGIERVEALVTALAAGQSIAAAAKAAGMGERTAYRYVDHPDVKARIRAARAALFERSLGRLADTTLTAVEALAELLATENESIRLRAAVAVLDHAVKLRESDDLARRLAELEAQVSGGEAGGLRGAA